MTAVSIPGRHGDIPGYLAVPAAPGPHPGVVVIHDALGMSTDLRNQADWLASEGFIAVAPDLYHWGRKLTCLFTFFREVGRGEGKSFDDIEATRRWLASHDGCTGTIGVIGFCLGGGFAVLVAPRGFAASSVNYGTVPKDASTLLADACPIVGSYGGRDPTLRKDPHRLEAILTEHGIAHDVKVYPEAGHAFLNDHDEDEVPVAVELLGKISRSAYHEPSAVDARARIVAFFREHLQR